LLERTRKYPQMPALEALFAARLEAGSWVTNR